MNFAKIATRSHNRNRDIISMISKLQNRIISIFTENILLKIVSLSCALTLWTWVQNQTVEEISLKALITYNYPEKSFDRKYPKAKCYCSARRSTGIGSWPQREHHSRSTSIHPMQQREQPVMNSQHLPYQIFQLVFVFSEFHLRQLMLNLIRQ